MSEHISENLLNIYILQPIYKLRIRCYVYLLWKNIEQFFGLKTAYFLKHNNYEINH